MKWHVTIETHDTVHIFDIHVREAREGFVPLLRKADALGINQHEVILITMELTNND